jgi:sorting nexin-8
MSLFGDDAEPVSTPTRRQKTSSSLFNESPSRGASLFSESNTEDGESPWSFPTPKRAARSTLIKSLLKPGDVPEVYVDVFDKLLAESDGHGVEIGAVRRLVRLAKLDEETGAKIEKTVVTNERVGLERGEVWVLLALMGLAQEGEEITLDSVDERKRSKFRPSFKIERC